MTSVLIQPRLRAHSTRLLHSSNINADFKGKIIDTLLNVKDSEPEEQGVKIIGYYLNHFAVDVHMGSSETVKV